jgi:hypothetical protein
MVIASGGAQVKTAAPEYSAMDFRRFAALGAHPGSVDPMGARTGVRPHSTAAVTVAGTTWNVRDTLAWMYPRETSTSGPYPVIIEAASGSLTAADGSNPRIDALDVYIQDDDEDFSGQRRVPPVLYTAGSPASSPTAPTLAAGRLRLATILVPAGGSPVPSVSTQAQFSHGPGILPVRTAAELPTSGLFESMYADQWDTNILNRYDGATWQAVASKIAYDYVTLMTGGVAVTDWTTYTPTVSGGGSATFSTRTGSWIRIAPKTVSFKAFFVVGAAGSGAGNIQVTTPTSIDRDTRQVFVMHADGVPGAGSNRNGTAICFESGSGTLIDRLRIENASAINSDSNMLGSDLGAGVTVTIQGVYQEA